VKNPVYVDLLRRAKKNLVRTKAEHEDRLYPVTGPARRKNRYICCALDHVTNWRNPAEDSASRSLQDLVEERLGGASTLEGWLVLKCHVRGYGVFNDPDNFKKAQRTRRAWIDSLIKEFS
jgi:hypothetical protein